MKRINRREFAKLAAGVALAVPAAPMAAGFVSGAVAAPSQAGATGGLRSRKLQAEPPKPEGKLKLTSEQEEAVKKAVERRDRDLAAIRARPLAYDAEPAFVFRVHQRPRGRPKA